ncbi:MAG: hypothetical protein MAG715_00989 [Methanonatronarchaeales archaeon]|nr:hypothetical protein [Methanonatronarchaeales archaeon]
MDKETVEKARVNVLRTAEEEGIELALVIVFGSRAGEDYRPSSDVDLVLVSPDFEGVSNYARPKLFYRHWNYDELPDPEFICLTPEEFEKRRDRRPNIVYRAVETGVEVA